MSKATIRLDDVLRKSNADPWAPLRIRKAVTDALGDESVAGASSESTKMLAAIGATGRHLYEGTVPGAVKARRRARNKRARAARRRNR